jgi:hypothetical protein
MFSHQAIPLKVSYTDTNGELVETTFSSLYKASKILNISVPALKELSLGGTPQLKPTIPRDIKVSRVPTKPKPPPEPKDPSGMWYCDLCKKSMKFKSKYEHIQTIGHVKKMGDIPIAPVGGYPQIS